MGARRLFSAGLVSLCAFAGAFAFGAVPASAFFTFPFVGQLAPSGGSFGFLDANSVAVNDLNGDTYVADSASGVVDVFDSSGKQLVGLDGSTTPAGSFGGGAVSVAANNGTGEVYVLDPTDNVVDEFDSTGAYLCQITGSLTPSATECNGPAGSATPAGGFNKPGGITVDQATGRVYVVDSNNSVIDVFSAGGAYQSQVLLSSIPGGFAAGFTNGVAVDDLNGHLYVSDVNPSVVYEFDATGSYLSTWSGSNTPAGSFGGEAFLSVAADDANGNVYVTTTITGEPNPGVGVTDAFDSSGAYVTQFSHSYNYPRGSAVDQASGKVYVSDDSPGVIDVFDPGVIVPDVVTEPASNVRFTSATLNGHVDPAGGPNVTSCQFEYGTSTSYGQTASCSQPLPYSSPSEVSADITSLQPNTTYHYRLDVGNEHGSNQGQDQTFATPLPIIRSESASSVTSASATLNATIDPNVTPTSYYFQYGTSVSYGSEVPTSPGVAIGSGENDLSVNVHLQNLAVATTYHYRVIAIGKIGSEVVTVDGQDETFTTQATVNEFALPDYRAWEMVSPPNKHGALIEHIYTERLIQASVNGDAISYATSAPTESEPQGYTNGMQVLSTRGPGGWASRDISPPNLVATGASIGNGQQFRFFSEDLSLSVVQPFGSFDPSVSDEASEQTAFLRTDYLHGNVNDPCVESCYRPLVTGKAGFANVPEGTIFGESNSGVPGSRSCPPILICGPEFVGATPDLSHIFLDSSVALTPEKIGELYEWAGGKLKASSRGELPSPRDLTSEDGSWVYSFSSEVLAPGGVAAGCACNLYVSHNGTTKLVAVLSGEDYPDWSPEEIPRQRTARVSPNGRWIAFMSQRELTGYNNHDAVSGKPDEEVYLYDAEANGGDGKLVCASCDPTGARPLGVEENHDFGTLASGVKVWEKGSWLAANIPGWIEYKLGSALYQSRYLSDSGRLFFNSSDALVPQDVNGTEDVYEYEPPGVGDCTGTSVTFGVRSGGCVGLISSGSSAEESAFLDASGSGGDVFFLTEAKLSSLDYDTALDVYDAHECTSAAPCFVTPAASPPACDTEASCRAAPTPQPAIFGSPSSSTFSGAGNVIPSVSGSVVKARSLTRAQKLARALRACGEKRLGRRRVVCRRQARARYAARRSSKANAKTGRG